MWTPASLLSERFIQRRNSDTIIVVASAILLQIIAEALAYPHPIGYDVVNYYIPVVANFDEHWESVSDEFPLYVLMLHSVSWFTGLPSHSIVVGSGMALCGLFSFATLHAAKRILRLGFKESIFITIFVIVQLAVLRTAWDLHRDLLAISTMLIVFSLISSKEKNAVVSALLIGLTILTVSVDRMVGLVFSVSLIGTFVMKRDRFTGYLAALATTLFAVLIALSFPEGSRQVISVDSGPISSQVQTLWPRYLVLFGVLNGAIFVPSLFGIRQARNTLLRFPFVLSGVAILAGLVMPNYGFLVPERWIIMFGIFAAVFSGYFLARLLGKSTIMNFAGILILAGFAVIGISYATMPYEKPFLLFALTKDQIEEFMPVTMQFNALDVRENDELLSAIDDINRQSADDAVIVGAKHWRGFMELYLEDDRAYKFGDEPEALAIAHAKLGKEVYLINKSKDGNSTFEFTRIEDSGRT